MKLAGWMGAIACGWALPVAQAAEPAHAQWGWLNLTPTLDTELNYTDNLFRTQNSSKSTWGTVITPRLQAWLQNDLSTYSLTYEVQDFRYQSSSDDNATDQRLSLDVHQVFNQSNTLNLYAKYFDAHEMRGTGLTEGDAAELIDKPVEFDYEMFGGEYTVGHATSTGMLQLEAKVESLEYTNFREATQYRDREADTLRSTFFYRTGPRTQLLAEWRRAEQDYQGKFIESDGSVTNLDNVESLYLLGLAWEASAKTSGEIKVGTFDRQYKSGTAQDTDGIHWQVAARWQPRTYSNLGFTTRRLARETNGVGEYIDTGEATLWWTHAWSSQYQTKINFLKAKDDYKGSSRNDNRTHFSASIDYNMRRWLEFGTGYRYEKRSSNTSTFGYTRNVFFIDLNLSL
ncbi:hypothetical protein EYC98_05820 [Halieaceae bacterium IMCC14734]|uniref:Outer membrane beta-barrel protein n=1 Tax=Candidatus Litorirhabdus singularis TaxID=2518993 RepID=A0ABT3TDN7_9GAMM|nr:outer membrane beta-barrel protein [Candidatus Litorirhabdus singularis]MCX2980388.1 hypothetical protein [Candidatus Litorirhabdus singularis]